MVTISCEVCQKDLGPESEAWVIQINEFKRGGNQLTMHFCSEHMKQIMGSIESSVKAQATDNGEA